MYISVGENCLPSAIRGVIVSAKLNAAQQFFCSGEGHWFSIH